MSIDIIDNNIYGMSVCNFVYSRDLGAQLWTIFDDEL